MGLLIKKFLDVKFAISTGKFNWSFSFVYHFESMKFLLHLGKYKLFDVTIHSVLFRAIFKEKGYE